MCGEPVGEQVDAAARSTSKSAVSRTFIARTREALLEQLRTLAGELERSHPGAAASLREGMEETLTVARLGVQGALSSDA